MGFINLYRSAPVRLSAAFAGASVLVMGVLLLVVYWSMIGLLEAHLDAAIDRELQILRSDLTEDGRDALIGLVHRQAAKASQSTSHVLVLDKTGRKVAGDLPRLAPAEGWQTIPVREAAGDDDVKPLRGRGEWLDDDTFVLIAHSMDDLVESRELVLRSFAWALAVTLVLALAGGLFIGVTLMRRVDRSAASARAIMQGELSTRIPTAGRGDELDRLSDAFNAMLERIEELMANLRHVTADIAHDLRSPLGRMRQRLETARLKHRQAPEYETAIDTAIEDADTIIKTFDAMLRIAQIESGAPRARFETLDLSGVVDNVCDAYVAVAEDTERRLVPKVEPGITLDGDGELLTQMLANLIENALHHTPARTSVEVRLERHRNAPRLVVSDNGPGIPSDERERVYRRFYRLDRSRATPGSGLGLSLVAAVAKLHAANVTLEDNDPAGLRVVVTFARTARA